MQRRATVVLAILGLLVAGCGTESAQPGATVSAAAPSSTSAKVITVPTVLILDASGSMTTSDAPGPRIDAAKKAAQGLIDKLPDDATIGLMTYGTHTGSSDTEQAAGCQDVTTLSPLGRLDRDRTAQQIAGLTPSGYTPISLSLQRAADQLPADNSGQAIILVSDGEDTCGTPPCDTAAALKQRHPGLNISTVGFKTEGPASEQLACIARVTGGLFVEATNADQLAARLIAVQNIDLAKKSLTGDGVDDIKLGQSLDDIRTAHPDFPDAARSSKAVVVYVDCDFGFVDGILDSITPHDGGRTIDGVTVGTDMARVSELYGDPVSVEPDNHVAVYRADPSNKQSAAGYRIDVDHFAQNGGRVTGLVKTIVLCRCASHAEGPPFTDASTSDVSGSGGSGHLAAVRLDSTDGYDRLVLEFVDAVPSYTVGYRPLPARADGSGDEIPLPGASALVQVTLTGATGDGGSGGSRTYFGPSTVTADTAVVTEAKAAGDFEAVLNWVVGVRSQVPFRVAVLAGPPRLVIEFQH